MLTRFRLNVVVAYMRQHAIPPDEQGCYTVALPESRVREAFDAGLAPFSLVGGTWRRSCGFLFPADLAE